MAEDGGGPPRVEEPGALIVGAGFAGLRMLYDLRARGIDAVVVEEGSDVGGTWFWNRYPGARTDSESWVYCYSFSEELQEEWQWAERYPSQPEVLAYLQHVADRFDLRRSIRFGTRVNSSVFDEATNQWVVDTDRNVQFRTRYVIFATGPLSKPVSPPFPGLESFTGESYLTARWPEGEVDLAGKRVAVIGTGATGIQVVPEVAKVAESVTVFQRTPNYAIPGRNRALTDDERRSIRARYDDIWSLTRRQASGFPIAETRRMFDELTAEEQKAVLVSAFERGGFEFLFTTYRDLLVNEQANAVASEFIRSHIRSVVRDDATARMLCPEGYPFGAKRPPLEHGYYEAFNRPNVSLVDVSHDPIRAITPRGVATGTAEYECDVLIFATGFDGSTGAIMAMDVRGRGSRSLQDAWAGGPRTLLGTTTDGFPNLFFICGPLSPFGNIPVVIEHQVRWIGAAIGHGLEHRKERLEPSPEAVDAWVEEVEACLNATLMRKGTQAHSWFLGLNVEGKPTVPLFYFGRANVYFDRLEEVAQQDFTELSRVPEPAERAG